MVCVSLDLPGGGFEETEQSDVVSFEDCLLNQYGNEGKQGIHYAMCLNFSLESIKKINALCHAWLCCGKEMHIFNLENI